MYGTASAPTYYTITNAASLVSGQQAIRFVMKGVGGPNSPTTGGTQFTATGAMCQWSIVEADLASVAGAVTRLVFYKTSGTPGIWGGVNLDLTTGVATLASGTGTVTYGVTKMSNAGPNGGALYLLWTATTNAGGETLNAYPYTITDGSASGTGKSVIVHHFQMEAGSLPSSPIVTTTAQVTRAADSAVVTDLSKIGFNPSEGTVVLQLLVPPTPSSTRSLLEIGDGTLNNRFYLGASSGNGVLTTSSVGGVVGATASDTWRGSAVGAVAKIALAYSTAGLTMSVNGAAAVTAALPVVPTVTKLGIGCTAGGVNPPNTWIQGVRYLPRRAAAAELQTLSA